MIKARFVVGPLKTLAHNSRVAQEYVQWQGQVLSKIEIKHIERYARRTIAVLDWLVMVMERILVLGISLFVLYIGWHLLLNRFSEQQNGFVLKIGEQWKIFGLLLIPLFYRTARAFLERAQKIAGIEARPLEKEDVPNPETK
jgi:hypothetical protein